MICKPIDELLKEYNINYSFFEDINPTFLTEVSKTYNTFVFIYNTFVIKSDHEQDDLIKQLYNYNYIFYKNKNTLHTKYSYYKIVAFNTEDFVNVKKILKTMNLKAFL